MSKPAYLIDTDWVIDHLNQVKEVKDKIAKYADKGLAISIIIPFRFTKHTQQNISLSSKAVRPEYSGTYYLYF